MATEASTPMPYQLNSDFFYNLVANWGFVTVGSFVGGLYGLGFCYKLGVMARIDQIAMPILINWFGYAGLGAIMPTFQWYSAAAVRFCCAAVAGAVCLLIQKIACYLWGVFLRNAPRSITNTLNCV